MHDRDSSDRRDHGRVEGKWDMRNKTNRPKGVEGGVGVNLQPSLFQRGIMCQQARRVGAWLCFFVDSVELRENQTVRMLCNKTQIDIPKLKWTTWSAAGSVPRSSNLQMTLDVPSTYDESLPNLMWFIQCSREAWMQHTNHLDGSRGASHCVSLRVGCVCVCTSLLVWVYPCTWNPQTCVHFLHLWDDVNKLKVFFSQKEGC